MYHRNAASFPLAGICNHTRRFHDLIVRMRLRRRGLKATSGCRWVGLGSRVIVVPDVNGRQGDACNTSDGGNLLARHPRWRVNQMIGANAVVNGVSNAWLECPIPRIRLARKTRGTPTALLLVLKSCCTNDGLV